MRSQKEYMPYRVGGLLYTPATDKKIANKLIKNSIQNLTSIVFCLEDSIGDTAVEEAEKNVISILDEIKNADDLPLLFIRVRNPEHMMHMSDILKNRISLLTGFVLPKFDCTNMNDFFSVLDIIIKKYGDKYIMPILESKMLSCSFNRVAVMCEMKKKMDQYKKYILNVRVGGNDFSNIYGLRRNITQNIYQMGVVRDTLIDILSVFSSEYIVSGPVWEYYDNGTDDKWKIGLKNELELDKINGFIGKTAIHPSQLPIIYESLMPFRNDYEDAKRLLDWDDSIGVEGSIEGNRMNEVKTGTNWAKKTIILGNIYGVKEEKY